MKFLTWKVIGECEVKNNGKNEKFDMVIAIFSDPWQAEDFINMCLPKATRSKFRVERIVD